jgi:hypothetical protein
MMPNSIVHGFLDLSLIGSEAIAMQFGQRLLRRFIGRLIPWRFCPNRCIRAVLGNLLDVGLAGVLTARVSELASNPGVDRGEILRFRGFGEKL